jgi:hypothetical protein
MDWDEIASLIHFRELHFLPRVIFSIGAIFLIGAFFVKLFTLGFLGVGVILAGSALNLVINTLLSIGRYHRDKTVGFPWTLFWQAILALALTVITLWLLYFFYRHGKMPTFLRPSTDCSIGTDWR